MFNNYFNNKIIPKIINYTKVNYNKISKDDMILGDAYYNRRCQFNAVQYVKKGNADSVYLCIVLDENDTNPVIHFINKKNNKFVDNTLGWIYEHYSYYIIRKVDESEYTYIDNLLEDSKNMVLDLFISRFTRKIFKLGYLGI